MIYHANDRPTKNSQEYPRAFLVLNYQLTVRFTRLLWLFYMVKSHYIFHFSHLLKILLNKNIFFEKRANKRFSSESPHCSKNLIYTKSYQCKYGAKKCKLQLNQKQRWWTPHLLSNLQPHVNWDANAVFTIFAFDFLLVCTSCSRCYPSVAGLEITIGQAPDTLSGQTRFCSDIGIFGRTNLIHLNSLQ